MSKKLLITEKPSVAMEFAKALKITAPRKNGYIESNEWIITWCVEHLRITTHGEKAYQFSYKLRNYFSNSYYHEIIMTKVDRLYNKTSFPVGDVDQNRYHTCYNIMYLLYHADKEKFLNYCTDIKKDCDKMSRHRIEVLSEEIMKDQKT